MTAFNVYLNFPGTSEEALSPGATITTPYPLTTCRR